MTKPEMRSDRLRDELAEMTRQRDLLREALLGVIDHAADYVANYHASMGGYRQDLRDKYDKDMDRAWAALESTEPK